jgi:hypothetical protein
MIFKKMKKKHFISIFFLVLLFQNCNNAPRSVKMAFYHWKTTINPDDFKKIDTSKVYIKLFDVDWDDARAGAKLLAEVSNLKLLPKTLEFVPTIFLTNKVFSKFSVQPELAKEQINELAFNIFQKITKYTEGGNGFSEVQFDCDWTATTRDSYFYFLKQIKNLFLDKKISATIRLHQIKFMDKTGVPPVDRGMLMAYNMGDLDDIKTENSILNIEILKSYSKNFDKYPLELDVALPIFSWGIVFRDGQAVKIINNLSKKELLNTPFRENWDFVPQQYATYFQQNSDNRFVLLKNQYLKGLYLYENDEIRIEDTPLSNLRSAATLLAQNIKNKQLTVAFYHLDSVTLQQYRYEDLENITQQFR